MGSGALPRKILVLDPILCWADLPMVLCMIFTHGFGRDGFHSMVLDAMFFQSTILDSSACINMYCNIERNIMKNQAGSPGFGIEGKSLCICVLCVILSHYLFSVF